MNRLVIVGFSFICIFTKFSIGYGSSNVIEDAINQILQHAQSSIHHIEETRIFFKSDKVCCFEGKIYVKGDCGEAISIPHLFSNENGVFLEAHLEKNRPWVCMNCFRRYDYKPLKCKCGHREFEYIPQGPLNGYVKDSLEERRENLNH